MKRANADLLSMNYETIKMVAFQSKANRKAANANGQKRTYLFRFNVTAGLNLNSGKFENITEAAHADDICYMFQLVNPFVIIFSKKKMIFILILVVIIWMRQKSIKNIWKQKIQSTI